MDLIKHKINISLWETKEHKKKKIVKISHRVFYILILLFSVVFVRKETFCWLFLHGWSGQVFYFVRFYSVFYSWLTSTILLLLSKSPHPRSEAEAEV